MFSYRMGVKREFCCFEDFTSLNNLSVIPQLGSKRHLITEIEMARPGILLLTPSSA